MIMMMLVLVVLLLLLLMMMTTMINESKYSKTSLNGQEFRDFKTGRIPCQSLLH